MSDDVFIPVFLQKRAPGEVPTDGAQPGKAWSLGRQQFGRALRSRQEAEPGKEQLSAALMAYDLALPAGATRAGFADHVEAMRAALRAALDPEAAP